MGTVNADELREALGTLGWNQARLASFLGVTEGAVSRWLSGERRITGPAERLISQVAGRRKAARKRAKGGK